MNEMDNHHAFKMVTCHASMLSLNHLSLYDMCLSSTWLLNKQPNKKASQSWVMNFQYGAINAWLKFLSVLLG